MTRARSFILTEGILGIIKTKAFNSENKHHMSRIRDDKLICSGMRCDKPIELNTECVSKTKGKTGKAHYHETCAMVLNII